MFNIIPELNAIKELFFIDENTGIRKLRNINEQAQLKVLVENTLESFINNLVQDKINTWKSFGFVENKEKKYYEESTKQNITEQYEALAFGSNDINADALNYVYNYVLGNVNIMQLFTTDIANYWKSKQFKEVLKRLKTENPEEHNYIKTQNSKRQRELLLKYYTIEDWYAEHSDTFDNYGKRLAADIAPGEDIPNSYKDTFTVAHVQDQEKYVPMIQEYNKLLGENNDYTRGLDATDAQEYTTLEEHLDIMVNEGEISTSEKAEYLRQDKEADLTKEALSKILQPRKPVYVANHWQNGIQRRIYIKSSSFPLSKTLTKGLEIDKLRKAMETQKIDRLAFIVAIFFLQAELVLPSNDSTLHAERGSGCNCPVASMSVCQWLKLLLQWPFYRSNLLPYECEQPAWPPLSSAST